MVEVFWTWLILDKRAGPRWGWCRWSPSSDSARDKVSGRLSVKAGLAPLAGRRRLGELPTGGEYTSRRGDQSIRSNEKTQCGRGFALLSPSGYQGVHIGVTPANAGVQSSVCDVPEKTLDSRLRGNDGVYNLVIM